MSSWIPSPRQWTETLASLAVAPASPLKNGQMSGRGLLAPQTYDKRIAHDLAIPRLGEESEWMNFLDCASTAGWLRHARRLLFSRNRGDRDTLTSLGGTLMSYPHRKWDAGSSFWVDVTIDGVEEYLHPKGDGISRTWHPNGQLASEYERKIGKTVAELRQWHDNGVLARVTPYVTGIIHGVVREWDKDGKLLREDSVSEAYTSDLHRWLDERFYEWALRDFQREIAQDFPFLRRVGGTINRKVIAIMKSLPLERQKQLATTLVRTNKVWFSGAPTRWTAEDEANYAWYGERKRQLLREGPVGNTLGRRATFIRDKRELMRAVREELMLVFPGETPEKSNEELNFRATLHGFDVETVVYSGHRTWQLWYLHRLLHPASGLDVNHISLMSWLGISGATEWSEITEATIPGVAKTVGDLCRHFIAAADTFLVGSADRPSKENAP